MKKKRKGAPETPNNDWEERLKRFLASPLAVRASAGLSDRISIALHVDEEHFFFRRSKGVSTLSRVEEAKPDVHFWIPSNAMRHILSLAESPDTSIGVMGVTIFEHIFSRDDAKRIKFRVDTGFLGLWSKGYFSVLKAGGPEVASYLARFGFHGLNAIKEVLKKSGFGS